MNFTLKVQQLKTFFKLAAGISQNNILPILSFIKLEEGRLTKTNVNTHLIYKVDAPGDISLLLAEKELKSFLFSSSSDQIKFTTSKKKVEHTEVIEVVMEEGKRKMKFQSSDVKDFPTLPEGEKSNEYELNQDTLRAIGVASKSIDPNHIATLGKFVHLWNGLVVGADGNKLYRKKTDCKINMLVSKECANFISEFGSATYYSKATFDYFEIGSILYAFIKTEAIQPDLTIYVPNDMPEEYLEVDVADIKSFCDTVKSASSSQVLLCNLNGSRLTFVDSEYDIDFSVDLDTVGKFQPDLPFLPATIGNYLSSLGFSTIKICDGHIPGSVAVYSDDDKDFAGTIMKLLVN